MTNVRSVLRVVGCIGLLSAASMVGCGSGEPSESEPISQVYQPATLQDANFTDSVFMNISDGTGMTFAPDGRLFVSQKSGQLRVIKNGQLLSNPFLTVPVFVIAWLWMLAAMVVAVQHALDYQSAGRAVVVCVVALALAVGLGALIGLSLSRTVA